MEEVFTMTRDALEKWLIIWGHWTANQETAGGYSSRSITAVMQEYGCVGMFAQSTGVRDGTDCSDDLLAVVVAIDGVAEVCKPRYMALRIKYAQAGPDKRRAIAVAREGMTWGAYCKNLGEARQILLTLIDEMRDKIRERGGAL